MNTPTKRKPAALALAVAIVAMSSVFIAAPAYADNDNGSLAPDEAQTTILGNDNRSLLEDLSKTQTDDEIENIIAAGGPVELLVETETGEVLAALNPSTVLSPFAITPVGPGCSTTSLCMTNTSNIPYGYQGTGSLNGTWASTKQYKTGNRSGAFTYNGLRWAHASLTTINLTSPATITKIERW